MKEEIILKIKIIYIYIYNNNFEVKLFTLYTLIKKKMKIIIIYIYNFYYIYNAIILFHSRILINNEIKSKFNRLKITKNSFIISDTINYSKKENSFFL